MYIITGVINDDIQVTLTVGVYMYLYYTYIIYSVEIYHRCMECITGSVGVIYMLYMCYICEEFTDVFNIAYPSVSPSTV